MFLVEASTLLPFAPEAVLAAAGSVESALRWQSGVLGVRRARHAGVLVVSYYALGERHALAARVTRSDPGRGFTYRGVCPAFALEVALDAAPALGGARLVYQLRLTTPPPNTEGEVGQAALRRLLGRRAPRDLVRLEAYVARRTGRFVRRPATPLDATLDALAAVDALVAPAPAAPATPPDAPAVVPPAPVVPAPLPAPVLGA